jgi:hypothetical protein
MDDASNADVDEDSLDVMDYFDVIGETLLPQGKRPEDYPGCGIQTVLHTSRRHTAGKKYRPDPSGVRRAIKVSDYDLGSEFQPEYCV